ncbi:hypothetical protein D3C80_2037470 [compost metagenome]
MTTVQTIDALDPNAWTTGELINIGLVAALFLVLLVGTTYQAFYAMGSCIKRVYWMAGSVLMWAGIAGWLCITVFAP